jgi:amino acid adenylation domain-containing protein
LNVSALVAVVAAQGVELWFEGDRLRFRSPKGALTAEQRAELSARKGEVLAHLRAQAALATTTCPLSFSQRSLWFVNQEAPESAAYNVGFAARIVSSVDVGAIRQAVQALCDRHPSLRTTFPIVDGVPVQRIAGTSTAVLELHEVAGDDNRQLHDRVMADYRRPFDLEHGPVFRSALYSVGRQNHVFLLTVHHIAADGWSLLQLLEELRPLYAEATGGPVVSNVRPPVDYAQFTRWQAEMLAGEEGQRLANYWRTQMASPRAEVTLPTDRPRPSRRSTRGGTFSTDVGAATSTRLRQIAKDQSTTLFVVLLAAFKTLLYRYTGTNDIVVGTPTFGRNRPEFARVVGDFVNTIPLRSRFDPDVTFGDLVGRLKKTVYEALDAQDYPFPLLVEQLQPVRDPSRSPLFEVLFVVQRFDQLRELEAVLDPAASTASVDFGGLELTYFPLDQQEGQFDLTLQVVDRSGSLPIQFKYNRDLFDDQTITALAHHFRVLLDSIVADPAQTIGRLPLLTAEERAALLGLGATPVVADREARTLHERFEAQVRRSPEAIAATCAGAHVSYGDLNRRANRLAHRLRQSGVGRDTLVGLYVERSLDLVVALIGILKAGGAYVPIDLAYPADRVAFMLADALAPVLVTQHSALERLPAHSAATVCVDDALDQYPDTDPAPLAQPDDLAYVIYTSGSTGRPKGTMLAHRAVDRLFTSTDDWYGFGTQDVWTLFHSIAFDFSVWEVWGALLYGGRLVVVPFMVSRSPEAFLALLHDEGVTVLNQTPSAFRQLMHADFAAGAPRPTRLRYVIFGGEALELQSLRPWFERYGDTAPSLVNMYGITETCVHVTYRPITLADLDAGGGSVIGKPIRDLRVHVLDAQQEPVPFGVPGEMYVGGPGLARGYLNRQELTAARFIADPFVPGDRLYRTGDLARRRGPDQLQYIGRIDQQVKIRGFRVELGEIEAALNSSPAVAQCAVVIREDRPGDQRLIAYVVPVAGTALDAEAVRAFLRLSLPDYMVPGQLIEIAALPLTSNGKIDRSALSAYSRAAAPALETVMTPAQSGVAEIWREVLGIDRVGLRDNFFDLGGHSLLLTSLQAALNRRFGATLKVVELFEHTTVADQAKRLAPAERTPEPGRVREAIEPDAAARESGSNAVAIIGMAGRFPGASGLDAFWRLVLDGVEALETFSDRDLEAAGVPETLRRNPRYVRRGTVLDDIDQFDAAFFRLSPRDAQVLDPQHRLFLECAWEALEHAGYAAGTGSSSVGVYGGVGLGSYLPQIGRDPALAEAVGPYQVMLSNEKDFLCSRVSYKLDLHGPSVTIQTACSTSLVAVEAAYRAVIAGDCDMALAGGVSIVLPQRGGYLYQDGMILSPDGRCRPFDALASGTRLGAGCGMVLLKRLQNALADRDTIHAVIRGAAVNNDGGDKAGYTAPSVAGQAAAISKALTMAGVDARSVSYIEAHGTATTLGDPIEIAALNRVFRTSTPDVGFCRLGALKANIGHLDAAAGVAGLIKTVLALQHRTFPPLVNYQTANPALDLESSPFVASAASAPWESGLTPRRAGVSSFGIGGTNAHVVIEEAPPVAAGRAGRDAHLLVLSARTPAALEQATKRLTDHLRSHPDAALCDVEWTLQAGRRAFQHRRAVVATDAAHAVSRLAEPEGAAVITGSHQGDSRPIAFLFSGQGSQFNGMGAGLYRSERVYREAVDECADLLGSDLGVDLREVMFGDPDTRITETRFAQPALFVTEYALATLWMRWGIAPTAMMGHSIGEYVAAHLSGVMSLRDALIVVAARGRLMQALPPGSMAAVHLARHEIAPWLGEGLEIAAVNADRLCTVSGSVGAVADMVAQLAERGVDSRLLHTSHAFHSAMMEPAVAPFTRLMQSIALSPPKRPYVSNLTGTWITAQQATTPSYYGRHLREAVQFEAGIKTLSGDPDLHFLEIGPGGSLTSLARVNLGKGGAQRTTRSLGSAGDSRPETETMLEAAGRLWVAGAALDWPGLQSASVPRRVPLPTYPFERERQWVQEASVPKLPRDTRDRVDAVEEWLFAPTWTRDDSLAGRSPHLAGAWLIVGGPRELAAALQAELTSVGANAVVVDSAPLHRRTAAESFPATIPEIVAIARHARSAAQPVAGVIALWTADAPASIDSAYHAQVALVASLAVTPTSPVRVVVVTTGAQSVLDEPVHDYHAALAMGPVHVLPTELPGLDMRAVDIAVERAGLESETVVRAIVQECAADDAETLVALRRGRRWVRRFEKIAMPPDWATQLPVKPGGVYLITGGTGGIGLTLARGLASQQRVRLLLTGRRALPPRDQWNAWLGLNAPSERTVAVIQAIRAIEDAGSEVVAIAADAGDPAAMDRAIAAAQARWGPIDGVIHAAGVPGHGHIAFLKSSNDVAAVLAPKVSGLDVMVRALGDSSLDFFVMMSALVSLVGAPGLADYVAANAVLDGFVEAASRPRRWQRVLTINWGAWRDVGMAAILDGPESRRTVRDAQLQNAIPPSAGLEAFERALASGRKQVVVVPFDLRDAFAARRQSVGSIADAGTDAGARGAARDLSSGNQAPASEIEQRLVAMWMDLLGVEHVGVNDDFFELGGHSLLATRVLARIDEMAGVQLTLQDVFDAPTVKQLAARLEALISHRSQDREEIEL